MKIGIVAASVGIGNTRPLEILSDHLRGMFAGDVEERQIGAETLLRCDPCLDLGGEVGTQRQKVLPTVLCMARIDPQELVS
jgi:hypothetical protein